MFTILLDKYFFEWRERMEFVEARILRRSRTGSAFDVAFVEGAITADSQIQRLKKIRDMSKVLVAIGSCACTGMPAAIRNDFTTEQKQEIEFILDRFQYSDRVRKIDEIVKVDKYIPGCPMSTDAFLLALNELFVQFGHPPVDLKK
ncbi:hypothetical protein A3J15_02730 [Candidatus Roizmanbacteria bacterium RIFCSPLOWO2_02_FULL_38_10]|uniref:NADH:ubiquinone oxidoreductase-like 20kDa subunit domain-containing protein n=1 Tax=Candidatus Roizmanbacteria bacterium RIFCSPLOWO2_02_FULL_38_10 TaxID=1802074 RepID=A0A1F7JJY7_9BACT|nr:MAG: hypothetical protein A3J15_02730 [Candidatus Roizmanbacteria bacterium RIFCSPLOWO2_02_FULL_38_10]